MARRGGLLFRLIRAMLLLAIVLAGAALFYLWHTGAWYVLFPSSHHDTVAPGLPPDLPSPAVLVFSKTNGFRHKEGIPAGERAIARMARRHGWGFFATENGAVFNAADLDRFDAVVFNNATGDMLSDAQQQAFRQWLQAGGGWLGIHAAGDDSHTGWSWYIDQLIGAEFTAHIMNPQFQRATVVGENHDHPALQGIANIWQHEEEWYSWAQSPRVRGFTILATLDEGSYTPVQNMWGRERDLRMGDHPVVWSHCVGQGRTVYAAMGHKAEAFQQPQFLRIIDNTLSWLVGRETGGCQSPADIKAG